MKKFFVKNLCFCCGVGRENKKKTSVPFVQQVAIHDILPNANGKSVHDKPVYTNKAFKKDDSLQKSTSTTSKYDPYFHTRQLSQLSNISEIFRLPLPDEKSLGEVVIDEYDRKSKSLHAAETGDLSDHSVSSRTASRSSSTEQDQTPMSHDQINDRLALDSNISKSVEQKSSSRITTNHEQSIEIATKITRQDSESKRDSALASETESNDVSGENDAISDDESVTSLASSIDKQRINAQDKSCQEKNHQINHVNSVLITA